MDNTREKLIELLLETKEAMNEICENTSCKTCQYDKYGFNCGWAVKADHLIANGVKIPVLCKECKHCDFCYPAKEIGKEAIPAWYCTKYRRFHKPDDFCSYGEKREDKEQ